VLVLCVLPAAFEVFVSLVVPFLLVLLVLLVSRMLLFLLFL
jgi:hypothetical protein